MYNMRKAAPPAPTLLGTSEDDTVVSTGGKKMKKYPRILDYLEAHHPDVWSVIDDLAMHGSLTPRRGGAITFLLPDAKYIDEIRKVMASDNPEKATDIISSLILTDLFESPKDFSERRDDVPNLLGNRLLIKGVSTGKVSIDDGFLVPDPDFKPFERQGQAKRGNMSVWLLSGCVNLNTPKTNVKSVRVAKKNPPAPPKQNGQSDESFIADLVAQVEKDKIVCVAKQMKSNDGKMKCPMLDAVCRVLCYFESSEHEEYKKARSIITHHPLIDFYLLFQNPDVFTPSSLRTAIQSGQLVGNHANYLKNYCDNNVKDDDSLCLNKSGMETLNEARADIFDGLRPNANTYKQFLNFYASMDNDNILNGKSPVYPVCLQQIYKSKRDSKGSSLHLLVDEVIHFLYDRYNDTRSNSALTRAKNLKQLIEDFHITYGDLKWKSNKTILDKPSSYGSDYDKEFLYKCQLDFIRKFGIRMPYYSDLKVDGYEEVGSNQAIYPYASTPIEVGSDIIEQLEAYDNSDIALSETAKAELRSYMARTGGKLPEL
jgi:hypothetical protein